MNKDREASAIDRFQTRMVLTYSMVGPNLFGR